MFALVKNKCVYVEGKGQVRQRGDKSQGWVCKTEEELELGCCCSLVTPNSLPPSLQWSRDQSPPLEQDDCGSVSLC